MATNKKWTVTKDGGMFYAPYIPQFITKKEPKMSLRKRFLQWLLAPDDSGKVLPYDEADEPMKARRSVNSWSNAINTMSSTRKSANAILVKGSTAGGSRDEPTISSRGITFKLFPARGGIVVETYYYDDKIGDDRNTLHLIAEDEELAEALAKIITMEAARS